MTLTYKGRSFSSQKAIADRYGIKPGTFYARIGRGLSIAQAVELKGEKRSIKVEYNGNEYSSISSLAQSFDIRPEYIYGRLKKGMSVTESVDNALTLIKLENLNGNLRKQASPSKQEKYKVWEDYYRSIKEIVKQFNLKPGVIDESMPKYEIESSIISYMKPHIKADYKKLDNIGSLAKHYGLQPDNVYQRLKIGWDLTEAIVIPVRKRYGNSIVYSGKRFVSRADLANFYNVDFNYIYPMSKRLSITWMESFEIIKEFIERHSLDRFTNPPKTIGSPYQVIFDGIWFKSITELTDKYGLNKDTLRGKKGEERMDYIKEIAGEPSGPCFNYLEEWNKFLYEKLNSQQ